MARKQGARPRGVDAGFSHGEPGRCGECQTQRRPVGHYAGNLDYDRWLCDRCVIELLMAGIRYLPWEQREAFRDDPNAAYNLMPEDPALRR